MKLYRNFHQVLPFVFSMPCPATRTKIFCAESTIFYSKNDIQILILQRKYLTTQSSCVIKFICNNNTNYFGSFHQNFLYCQNMVKIRPENIQTRRIPLIFPDIYLLFLRVYRSLSLIIIVF